MNEFSFALLFFVSSFEFMHTYLSDAYAYIRLNEIMLNECQNLHDSSENENARARPFIVTLMQITNAWHDVRTVISYDKWRHKRHLNETQLIKSVSFFHSSSLCGPHIAYHEWIIFIWFLQPIQTNSCKIKKVVKKQHEICVHHI